LKKVAVQPAQEQDELRADGNDGHENAVRVAGIGDPWAMKEVRY